MVSLASAAACSRTTTVENFKQGADNLIHNTRILHPKAAGNYPVLVFLHGFALDIEVYDAILCDSAETNIVILFQMKFNVIGEKLGPDAELIMPYLYDPTQGIMPRIGTTFLPGFSYSRVGIAGHSRGGGVLAYGYSHAILKDGDFTSVTFIDPVVGNPDEDVPTAQHFWHTKMRTLYFNDPKSICVTHGWPDAIGAKLTADDMVVNSAPECKHMDVCSSWGAILPMCHSFHAKECKQQAMDSLTSAGYGVPTSITV